MPAAGGAALLLAAVLPAAAACGSLEEKCFLDLPTGIRMAYVETGPADGPAVILLHGLTDTARSWSPAMAALHAREPRLHILAPDQRGHGASSMPPGSGCPADPKSCFTPRLFADDLAAFMDGLKIARATVAGHSMGSIVAQEMALDHPERVERVVLVATTGRARDNPAIRDGVLRDPVLGRWQAALQARGAGPQAVWNATPTDADPNAQNWIAWHWDVDPLADPALVKAIVPETAATRLGTWIGASEALLDTDNTARLAEFKVPALILWGAQDTIFPHEPDQVALIEDLRKAALTNAIPVIWKQYGIDPPPKPGQPASDLGHNLPWEAPDEVATDMASFIHTGKPTPDLYRTVDGAGGRTVRTEPGSAMIVTLP
ncbi:alpha/beta fold hydrolase [Labrys wisconsinensis]|uniref:Pimeloyl-ACP methyl ester carboxylesterase n=1 Tax=Labrys wisconsinensis TaxID=425677 RepID=A0ABU0JIN4_9HYPH|nr:alpha/beta hydrolase [Labrys wisconsinensis]MDQ0474138.1 pimeloyl-ACP methyl ester carboxylesterase [Labrys wisconsinensis]